MEVFFPLPGHHETPLSASTKMLERFPNNLPKHRENVIPADSEKKSFEDVSGAGRVTALRVGWGDKALLLPLELTVDSAGESTTNHSW